MTITLYVKTHNVTGLKYFGKTTKKDPHKYRGSGKYWKKHIKKYGYDVKTEIIGIFEDESECEAFAMQFSIDNNIVHSLEWANLILENGLDGAPKGHIGHKFTNEQLLDISEKSTERWKDDEFKERTILAQKDSWTDEKRNKYSEMKSKYWTTQRREDHSNKLKGRPGTGGGKGIKKKAGHGENVSKALRGIPKTEEHKQAMRKPKRRVCRISDKKEMTVGNFTRWVKSLIL